MRLFAVTVTTHHQVMLEAETDEEAKRCARSRFADLLARADDFEVEAVEVKIPSTNRDILKA